MIGHTFHFLTEYLNTEFKLLYGIDEDKVVMGNLVDPDGNTAAEVTNKIVLTLVSLEHVTNAQIPSGRKNLSIGGIAQRNDPVLFNMYIMVSSNYESKQYHEALKMLNTVIATFQVTNVFPRVDFPEMHPTLEKITMEIVNLPLHEQIGVWNNIGARLVPSVLYKLRLVTIDIERIDGIIPEVAGLASKALKKNED